MNGRLARGGKKTTAFRQCTNTRYIVCVLHVGNLPHICPGTTNVYLQSTILNAPQKPRPLALVNVFIDSPFFHMTFLRTPRIQTEFYENVELFSRIGLIINNIEKSGKKAQRKTSK